VVARDDAVSTLSTGLDVELLQFIEGNAHRQRADETHACLRALPELDVNDQSRVPAPNVKVGFIFPDILHIGPALHRRSRRESPE